MLKALVEADGQVLKSAAARLDQLPEDIGYRERFHLWPQCDDETGKKEGMARNFQDQ
jgi:hypothetical protein